MCLWTWDSLEVRYDKGVVKQRCNESVFASEMREGCGIVKVGCDNSVCLWKCDARKVCEGCVHSRCDGRSVRIVGGAM